MTDSHWGEMVRAMDKLNMNIIVIQEVFAMKNMQANIL